MPRILMLVLCTVALPAAELEVRAVQWGFDGTVVPGTFNPVAVLVANGGSEPVEGPFLLVGGGASPAGAPYATMALLAPGAARWLSFTPWIDRAETSFVLRGPGIRDAIDCGAPKAGGRVTIRLLARDQLRPALGGRGFDEELFPATVAATDGLAAVVLDHTPRWSPAQATAFRDWLVRGGRVELAPGIDGQPARLVGGLADVVAGARLGRGLVRTALATDATAPSSSGDSDETTDGSATTTLFAGLADLVQADHAWWLILVLSLCFLLLVGPVAWVVGRRARDWRVVHGGVVLAIVATAWLLYVVGRRGYGESTQCNALAVAVPVAEGTWDVRTWASAFATTSGTLVVHHRGDGHCYACPSFERVDGLAAAGAQGALQVAVPLFTQRPFVHRGRLPGPALAARWLPTAAGRSDRLGLALRGVDRDALLAVWTLRDGVLREAVRDGSVDDELRFVETPSGRIRFAEWKPPAQQLSPFARQRTTLDELARREAPRLTRIALAADGSGPRLLLLARQPASFQADTDLGRQQGAVLYVLEPASDGATP